MGEVPTSLVEAAIEVPGGAAERVTPTPRRRITRRTIAIAVVGALVVVCGAVGGGALVNRAAHDQAVADAETAHATAVRAEAAHRATLAWLGVAVTAGIATRDGVSAGVLAHQDLLGGASAVASVAESNAELGATLSDILEVDAPTAETVIPDAEPLGAPAAVDPDASTEVLAALSTQLADEAEDADAARALLAARADEVETAVGGLGDELELLAASLPPVHQALLAGRPLASDAAKTGAATALTALGAADGAELPALLQAYAQSASGVIAAHDAEAARVAAEAAARQARQVARGGAAGGRGTEQRGVLSETNAQRAATGLGALSWNGTLAARSCAFAAELAANNGGLSHSTFAGGFSAWAENVASGYGSVSAVVAGWMASSGHRANILGSYSAMGACSATSATGRLYWVQQFGR